MKTEVEKAKQRNIIGMAISFSAAERIFDKGSTEKMRKKLYEYIDEFFNASSEEQYRKKHREFCKWMTENIMTSKRKGKAIKASKKASWGQAAKVIDIALKVCIYYCKLPSPSASSKIMAWLNRGIDTAILKDLKRKYHRPLLGGIFTLADITEEVYDELQNIIRSDIEKSFNGEIAPVQYDDMMWRELNQKD
jgi:hypothetical protein